jgi:O-antigen/teichoic acid export membrane protein
LASHVAPPLPGRTVKIAFWRGRGDAGWVFVDQMLWSGSNFLTTLILARVLPPAEFGTYVLAYSAWTIVLVAAREGFSQPFILLTAHLDSDAIRQRASHSTAIVVGTGVFGGLAFAVIGSAIGTGSTAGTLYLTLGVFVPFLLLQDHCRYVAFTMQRAELAVISDAVWAVLQIVAIAALYGAGRTTAVTVLLAWAGAGAVASTLSLRLLRVAPRAARAAWDQLRRLLALGRWTILSGALGQLLVFLQLALLAMLFDEAVVGATRAIQVLFMPLALVSTAMATAWLPRLAATANRGDTNGLLRRVHLYNAMLVGLSAAYVLPIVVFRGFVLREAVSDEFAPYADLVLPLAAAAIISAGNSAPEAGLKAMRQLRSLFLLVAVVGGARLALLAVVGQSQNVTTVLWVLNGLLATWTLWIWWYFVRCLRVGRRGRVSGSSTGEGAGARKVMNA